MWTLRSIEWLGRGVLRMAPASFRDPWGDDAMATLQDACLAAHDARGWRGLLRAGITELANLGRAALRTRLGRRAPIVMGAAPVPTPPRRRRGWLDAIGQDLRVAWRSLNASRTTAAIAMVTLAIGIGVNAAVFSILDSTLFRPVPFADADRLAEIWTHHTQANFTTPRSRPALLRYWRQQTDLFDRVEGYDIYSFVYTSRRGAELLTGAYVTPGLLPMLGIAPLGGRLLAAGDGRADAPDVVVISEAFWREALARAPDAIGRSITLNGRPHQIVGIAPPGLRFPNGAARIWVPFDDEAPAPHAATQLTGIVIFTRQLAGLDRTHLTEQVKARAPGIMQAAGAPPTQAAALQAAFHLPDITLQRSLLVLAGAVVFLLVIVCANLANLSLARMLARARDAAVRTALGASRAALVRHAMVEHAVIGVAGAALGLLVARVVIEVTLGMLPQGTLVRSMNAIDLDGRALAFTMVAGLAAVLCFGVPAAWLGSRAGVAEALKARARTATGSKAARRIRGGLVIAEVALSMVLLVGAALMARSFVKLVSVDRGFDSGGLVTLRLGLPAAGFADPYVRDAFTETMVDRVRRLPGVRDASAGGVPPETSYISFGQVEFERAPGTKSAELVLPVYQVWPTYFDTIGLPLRAGRAFGLDEPRESVIVSESFARAHFPAVELAVGQRFRISGGVWRTITGVAGEVRQFDLDDRSGSFEFYYPLKRPAGIPVKPAAQTEAIVEYRTIVARADDPAATARRMREATHDVDPRVVVWQAAPLETAFADALARPRLVLLLLGVFATLGLVLAAAGLYGVLSYLVEQRRRELGVRLALGARPAGIGRLVIGNGLGLTAVGIVAGAAAALALVRVMQTLLYDVEASDPWSVAAVTAVLLATAAIASWWPARRAMRIDPLTLLKDE